MQRSSLPWAVGTFGVAAGSHMLIAPHQFRLSPYAALAPHLGWWGVLFLVTGLALIVTSALRAPRPLILAAHLGAGLAWFSLVHGFAGVGAWIGAIAYAALGLGTLVSAPLAAGWPPRRIAGDLLGLTLAAGSIAGGLVILLLPGLLSAPYYDAVRDRLPTCGVAFLIGGLALAVVQLRPPRSSLVTWAAHALAAGAFALYLFAVNLPLQIWTGIAYYGGFAIVLLILPWLAPRLARIDPNSLRIRLAFILTVTAALPLILITSTIIARNQRTTTQAALDVQQITAKAIAADIANDFRFAGNTPAGSAEQAFRAHQMAAGEPSQVSLIDTAGRVIARSAGPEAPAAPLQPEVIAALTGAQASGQLRYSSPAGEQLGAFARVPTTDWTVFAERPAAAALAGTRVGLDLAFWVLIVIAALAIALGAIVAERLTRPLSGLAYALGRVGAGDLDAPLPRSSLREFEDLIQVFRSMRDHLAARTAERDRAERESAERLAQEQAARAAAEEARTRLAIITEASALLAASLEPEATLQSVARLVVPQLADWCAVTLVDDAGNLHQAALAHVDPDKVRWAHELQQRYPPDPEAPSGVPRVIRTGQAEMMREIPDELLVQAAQDPEHLRLLRELGLRSLIIVPLVAHDRRCGAITLVAAESGRRYGPEDLALAEDLARRAAVAIDNARLYQEARQAEAQLRVLNAALEERVRERTAQLEEAVKELEAFSYSVSHDLRAPLRAIDGFSRILIDEWQAEFPESAQRYLHLIGTNAKQMGQLIDDLLRFSRLNRQPLAKQPTDLARLARQVVDDLRPEWGDRPVDVRIGDLPIGQADPNLLRQVLFNLIDNAGKYTRSRAEAIVEVGWAEREGQGVYFVRDNGVGFDMRYVNKLFGVFQRLHRSTEYEGTGVGLALVQRIIHRHGGRIWAEAAVDRGATFYFTLGGSSRDDGRPD